MTPDFFQSNRAKLVKAVNGRPIILVANSEVQRVGDEAFAFAQEANFWYLTGVEAADWRVVIADGQTTLLAPKVSLVAEIFNGSLSAEDARKISDVDQVLTALEAADFLKKLARKHDEIYTIFPDKPSDFDFALNPAVKKNHQALKRIFREVKDARREIAKLRAIKTKAEIMMLRRAVNLTRSAFEIVKKELPNYAFEYEAQARFTYEFERAGAAHAYAPIVAGGKNAITLHYNANSGGLKRGDLVLMDVGARYGGYSADVTRTYAYHEVTERQKTVHAAVKQAKDEIIDLLKPDLAVAEYLEKSDKIIQKTIQSLRKDGRRKYCPHAVSHGLGVETHDPLGNPKTFQPGMVLTVEPGIYIPEENIGVRLEDDILITETGYENLSGRLSDDL